MNNIKFANAVYNYKNTKKNVVTPVQPCGSKKCVQKFEDSLLNT